MDSEIDCDLVIYNTGGNRKMERLMDYEFEMPQTLYNDRVSYIYICDMNVFTCDYLLYFVSGTFSVHNLKWNTFIHVYIMWSGFILLLLDQLYAVCNGYTIYINKVCPVITHNRTLPSNNLIHDEVFSDLTTNTHCTYSKPSNEHMYGRLYCSINNPLSLCCTDGQTFQKHSIEMTVDKTTLLLYREAYVFIATFGRGMYLHDLKCNRLLSERFVDLENNLPIFVTTYYIIAATCLTYDPVDVLVNGSIVFFGDSLFLN